MKISRRHATAYLLLGTGLGCAAVIAAAIARKEPPMSEPPRLEVSVTSAGFSTDAPTQSPEGGDISERLRDPQQREQLRAEQRAHLHSMNPELAAALDIEPDMANGVIDLLTDQQMAHLERWYGQHPDPINPAAPSDPHDEFAVRVAAEDNRLKQQIKDLLGAERYERYVDYVSTLNERRQVAYFEGLLEQNDKLSPDQRVRLMRLLEEQESQRGRAGIEPGNPLPFPELLRLSKDELDKERVRQHVASNEDLFRHMKEDSGVLLRRVRNVLTPKQLDAYARMEAVKIDGQRKHVQQLRVRAGMSPDFDERASKVSPPKRTPATGQVRLEITVRVDAHQPVTADFVIENGNASAAIQVHDGLWIEATPTLYEDGFARVDLDFYEQRGGQRRRIKGARSMGMMATRPEAAGMPLGFSGGSSAVSAGSKSYAISVGGRVSHVP